MFGIGMPELCVILVVALVVLGPKRLPEVARSLGKIVSEFRRQSSEIMDEFQVQMMQDEDRARRSPARPAPRPPAPSAAPAADSAPPPSDPDPA
jgi:sec-independent protein translocase protein TatB